MRSCQISICFISKKEFALLILYFNSYNKWYYQQARGFFRVGYSADEALKSPGASPLSPPRHTQRLGAGCLFQHSLPLSLLRPHRTHIPDVSPLKIDSNKQSPIQEMNAGGPRTRAGWGLPKNTPQVQYKDWARQVNTRPTPSCNKH